MARVTQRAKIEKGAARSAVVTIDSLTIRAGSFGQPALADIELVGYVQKGALNEAASTGNVGANEAILTPLKLPSANNPAPQISAPPVPTRETGK